MMCLHISLTRSTPKVAMNQLQLHSSSSQDSKLDQSPPLPGPRPMFALTCRISQASGTCAGAPKCWSPAVLMCSCPTPASPAQSAVALESGLNPVPAPCNPSASRHPREEQHCNTRRGKLRAHAYKMFLVLPRLRPSDRTENSGLQSRNPNPHYLHRQE